MSTLKLMQSGQSVQSASGGFTEAERGDVEALAGLLMKAIDANGFGKYREGMQGGITAAAEQAGHLPAERLNWRHLAAVEVNQGEEAVLSAWEEVKQAAREELASGHRAALVMEGSQATPMERARFVVLRESFADQWKPVNGIEWALIDQMTQAATAQGHWTEILSTRMRDTAAQDLRTRQKLSQQEQVLRWGEWLPERVSEAESMQAAMGMVDRWNRIYLRCLRQLRDLRRFNVVIQNAGQVNVGQQQVNVSSKTSQKRQTAKARRKDSRSEK